MTGPQYDDHEAPPPPDDDWPASGGTFPDGPGDRLPVPRNRRDSTGTGNGRKPDWKNERNRDAAGSGSAGRTADSFERVPPQDLAAEQSVLGGMLLSKDAIADVVEVLKPTDYYRPAHELIHDAILDLYARGEPADPITVAGELTKRGELTRVGGPPYLHTLVNSVPTAANAQYYAEIVHERAVLRRLVEAGTRIAGMGYAAEGDVDEIVNAAQAEIYAVTEQRTSEDYLPLAEIMEGALDEIEAIGSRSGQMSGVPTGFTDLDSLTNGLHPGQMIVVAARPAMGKCLSGKTPVLDARSGLSIPIEEFVRRGRAGEALQVHTLGADRKLRPATPSDYLLNGRRAVLRLTTGHGRFVSATPNHPFLTPHGWVPLEELHPGAEIAAVSMGRGEPDVHWDTVGSVVPDGETEVYDLTVDGTHNFVAAGLVVHNSTLALDFARACSVKNGMPSVIFSLEMSRNEIAMRLLSAEARVALHHMRSGTMTDEDWTRLARRMPDVSAAPLYIDDSPNLSMMEIRAKCRRLKQRNDLRLVVIDYLQLMQAGGSRRQESRQQEVSDMSRNLKLLAKELELPVVALSQLNRGPEQRTDKKPMVSDLRESGCVTAGTRLLRADTNTEVTIGELLESGARDVPVWSVDERLRLVRRTLTHAFPSGVKEAFRVTLASGRNVEATANHPFLTPDGWQPLGDLTIGSPVAVPSGVGPLPQTAARPAPAADALQPPATGDVRWDPIVSVDSIGEQPVFDATVLGTHNFIANGVVLHNSIEQDADMVILLHREDAYEKESPRAGEADLIVAKHRNGPTATITVAFQGHYSRFVDMANT